MSRQVQFGLRRLLIATGLLCVALALGRLSIIAAYVPGRLLAFSVSWIALVASVGALFHFRLRTTVLAAVIVQCLLPVYAICDVGLRGPQVILFNKRCEQVVRTQGLIGNTSDEVQAALGEPTSWYDQGPGHFTLNYSPHPFFPGADFQAHFTDHKLVSTELFDD